MKVVAFNGSPRKDGNTALLLRKVLAPIARSGIDTELVQVGGHPLHGCMACGHCMESKDRQCAIKTDIVNECIQKMIEADGIILGSPTYFAGMSSEMKALIDRAGFVAVANDRMFSRKIGAAVAAHRRGGAGQRGRLHQPHVSDVADDRAGVDLLELRRWIGTRRSGERRRGDPKHARFGRDDRVAG